MEKQNIFKNLGNNIKYYRHLAKYTQEQLAEKCNLSPRYVSDIENAKRNISIITLDVIASCLEVEPYLLIKDVGTHNLPKKVNMKK